MGAPLDVRKRLRPKGKRTETAARRILQSIRECFVVVNAQADARPRASEGLEHAASGMGQAP